MYRMQAVNRWLLKSAILGLLAFLAAAATTVADTTTATITSVAATADPTRVIIVFSEPVEENSATNVGNYNIDNGIIIFSASLSTNLKTVTLETSAHLDRQIYNLTNNNTKDASGKVIPETSVPYPFILGLVGYWRFDEGTGTTASDASGTGNTGTLVGSSTGLLISDPIWETGRSGQALRFINRNTAVVVSDSPSLRISTDEMTVAAWVKVNDFPSSNDDPAIVEKDGDTFMLALVGTSDNQPAFRLTTTSGTVTLWVKTRSASIGRWYHYVGVYDGSEMRLYETGVLIGSKPQSGPIVMSTDDLNIGRRKRKNSYLDGTIDEVRIYNRGLIEEEVLALYKSTPDTAPPSTPTNLQATVFSLTKIELSWTASTDNFGVTGYRVYRDGANIATTQNTTYIDTSANLRTTYTYAISAFDLGGNESAQSSSASAITENLIPGILNLTWTDNSNNEAGFKIERKQENAGTFDTITPTVVGANVTSYIDSGLDYETTYCYRVRAFNEYTVSAYSQEGCGTARNPLPERPTNLILRSK